MLASLLLSSSAVSFRIPLRGGHAAVADAGVAVSAGTQPHGRAPFDLFLELFGDGIGIVEVVWTGNRLIPLVL
jgi:hypothetical protein